MTRCEDRLTVTGPVRFSGYTGTYSGKGTLLDLSLHGCQLHTAETALHHGTIVTLDLFLGLQQVPVTVDVGLVRWCRQETCGVFFCFLESLQQRHLQDYLDALRRASYT